MSAKPTYEELEERILELEKTKLSLKRTEEAEIAMKKSRLIFDSTSDAVITTDLHGTITFWNSGAENIFGYKRHEVLGKSVSIIYKDADLPILESIISDLLNGTELSNVEVTCVDKSQNDVEILLSLMTIKDNNSKVIELVGLSKDITEIKRTQEALSRSATMMSSLLDNSPVPAFLKDRQGRYLFVNRNYAERVGRSQEEVVGLTDYDTVAEPETAESFQTNDYLVFQNQEVIAEESTFTVASGVYSFITVKFPVFNKKGEVYAVGGVAFDITDRKQAEDRLKKSEEKFRATFEQAAVGICHADLSGKFLRVNTRFADIVGYSKNEMLSFKWQDITHPEDLEADLKKARAVLDNRLKTYSMEKRFIKKDSAYVWINLTVSLARNSAGSPLYYIGVIEDISYRKEMEKQLQQSQKLESIGNLAGGIAHDFNNILSSIIGFTELALDDASKNPDLEDNLLEVYLAGKRAKDLVKQILAFARQSDEERRPIQPSVIVKEVLKLIRSAIPTTIKIRQIIESNSLIMGNTTQVHQVFLNLCTNAAHAMDNTGGVLALGMRDVTIAKENLLVGMKGGDYIEVKVSDTGVGIAPEEVESIFEPYFTTKGPGEGTGMGLAMAHGIVESYGGKITVDSQLGKGTTFTIFLPVTKKRSPLREYVSEQLPSGTEHILFVDDELPIAKMGSQVLERLGYLVTTRTSSIEALELFKNRTNDFDLIVTDMTMPNLTGDRLAVELMKIRRDIPVILCTGYSNKISDEIASKIGIKAFAYKPIVKADLAKNVRKVLDESKGNIQE